MNKVRKFFALHIAAYKPRKTTASGFSVAGAQVLAPYQQSWRVVAQPGSRPGADILVPSGGAGSGRSDRGGRGASSVQAALAGSRVVRATVAFPAATTAGVVTPNRRTSPRGSGRGPGALGRPPTPPSPFTPSTPSTPSGIPCEVHLVHSFIVLSGGEISGRETKLSMSHFLPAKARLVNHLLFHPTRPA